MPCAELKVLSSSFWSAICIYTSSGTQLLRTFIVAHEAKKMEGGRREYIHTSQAQTQAQAHKVWAMVGSTFASLARGSSESPMRRSGVSIGTLLISALDSHMSIRIFPHIRGRDGFEMFATREEVKKLETKQEGTYLVAPRGPEEARGTLDLRGGTGRGQGRGGR